MSTARMRAYKIRRVFGILFWGMLFWAYSIASSVAYSSTLDRRHPLQLQTEPEDRWSATSEFILEHAGQTGFGLEGIWGFRPRVHGLFRISSLAFLPRDEDETPSTFGSILGLGLNTDFGGQSPIFDLQALLGLPLGGSQSAIAQGAVQMELPLSTQEGSGLKSLQFATAFTTQKSAPWTFGAKNDLTADGSLRLQIGSFGEWASDSPQTWLFLRLSQRISPTSEAVFGFNKLIFSETPDWTLNVGLTLSWGISPKKSWLHESKEVPRVIRTHPNLHLAKIDQGTGAGMRIGEKIEFYTPAGALQSKGQVIGVRAESAAVQITEYLEEIPIEEGFLAKRLL